MKIIVEFFFFNFNLENFFVNQEQVSESTTLAQMRTQIHTVYAYTLISRLTMFRYNAVQLHYIELHCIYEG